MNEAALFDVAGPFLLLLGGLIFFHELGHFLVAKWFGVKVERFSLGFGPPLLRRTVGETEYQIAWLPLGGYVKMLGEYPGDELAPEDAGRTFNGQTVWRRIGISLAGPGMNFVLPIVILAAIYMGGMPTATSLVGSVLPGSAAERAGVLPGDRVTSVDGTAVDRWEALAGALSGRLEGSPLELEVDRGGESLAFTLEPGDGNAPIGLEHSAPPPIIAVRGPDTPAGRAGLQTGDRVTAVDGREVASWYALERALAPSTGTVELEVARALDGDEETVRTTLDAEGDLRALGVVPGDLEIREVSPDSPAERAGIRPGDVILELDGAPVPGFWALAERIRSGGGARLRMGLSRDGEPIEVELVPEVRQVTRRGELVESHVIGVTGGAAQVPGEFRDEVVRNPLRALWLGGERTVQITAATLEGFGKLVTRSVGLENLAGPIGIGKIAADSFKMGWFQFLWVCAVISVNLAILNLLPIPILDGGQIVFALAEWVKGGPVGMRALEIAQQVGISILIVLMGFAFWNDLSRYWSEILGFFQDLI